MSSKPRLYQFAISHFCEKARWALAYKEIDHELRNLLPGPHLVQIKKLGATRTATPFLVHEEKKIQGSAEIISYLDATFRQRPLTPDNDAQAREALEWERYLDDEIGVHARRLCYHTLLEHPKIVIPFFTHAGPWYGPMLYRFVFPKLKVRMRQAMAIDGDTAAVSREHLDRAVERVLRHLDGREFLVGDRFSRADLAAAALLAPLFRPAKYGLEWPESFPEPLEGQLADYHEAAPWVNRMYAEYR